ncbi:MAG: transposase family protein [Gemmatimonadetes bacterium]|nr:transposase family protein [Gemmatimonadota bacterium]
MKKLGRSGASGTVHGNRTTRVRGIGWEYVRGHRRLHARVAYAEVLADEQVPTTAAFLERAVAWYGALGITVRRLLTDNGGNYRSTVLAACCRRNRIRQYFTRPYRPQTNGKAERFIRTLLHEWAYARGLRAVGLSHARLADLPSLLQRRAAAHRAQVHHPAPAAGCEAVNNVFVINT